MQNNHEKTTAEEASRLEAQSLARIVATLAAQGRGVCA